jgi:hypothetical protein
MYFNADGRGFDANLGAAVDDSEGHARSLKERAASCGFSRVDEGVESEAGEVLQNVSEVQRKSPCGSRLAPTVD